VQIKPTLNRFAMLEKLGTIDLGQSNFLLGKAAFLCVTVLLAKKRPLSYVFRKVS